MSVVDSRIKKIAKKQTRIGKTTRMPHNIHTSKNYDYRNLKTEIQMLHTNSLFSCITCSNTP